MHPMHPMQPMAPCIPCAGRLIAVGVVDILPRCLSAVYLFWEPDARSLAPGKLTALSELDWVRKVRALLRLLLRGCFGMFLDELGGG